VTVEIRDETAQSGFEFRHGSVKFSAPPLRKELQKHIIR
jgi:hypothetical protein